MRDPNPVWPNERLRIAELEAERDRLREEVEWLQGYAEGHDEALTHLSGELRNARVEVERLREALREVNENLPGSCTDEKSWLAECLMDVREIISDALASTVAAPPRPAKGDSMSEAVAKMVAEHGLDGIVCIPRAQYDTLVTLLTKTRHLLNKANTYTELACGDCVRELDAALRAAGVGPSNDKCPRCNSSSPDLHPAVQYEGEVQLCPHPWHVLRAAGVPDA